MRNGKDNNSCLFGEQLVSYIYNELPASGRSAFEDHLLTCSGCTDEFAAISMSRLGVYEWHRDDFLPLETPVFSIPYQRPTVATETHVSWLDAIRGLFSPARLVAAGGAFAVLAIVFGAVYISITSSSETIADVKPVPAAVQPESNVAVPLPDRTKYTVAVAKDDTASSGGKSTTKEFKVIPAKATKRVVNRAPSAQQASIPQKAPRLGTYDEAEDTSLRLADLVADIDTKDF